MGLASDRIPFKIQACTSEDAFNPALQLVQTTPNSNGWATAKGCAYPQELVLELDQPYLLSQIQLLSHEHKIPSRVEVVVGVPANPHGIAWQRLGYITFDSNERSNWQARELKSAHVSVAAQFVKFIVQQCHVNRKNEHKQVGIVAINLIGERIAVQLHANTTTHHPVPNSSDSSPPSASPHSAASPHDASDVDPHTAARLAEIQTAKARAIAAEDYDEAKRLKKSADVLRVLGAQIQELETRKAAAVVAEEYDVCKALKAQVDQVRNGAEYKAAFALQPLGEGAGVGRGGSGGVGRSARESIAAPVMGTPVAPQASLRGHAIVSDSPLSPADAYDERPIKGRGTYVLDDADLEQLDPNTAGPPTTHPASPLASPAHTTKAPHPSATPATTTTNNNNNNSSTPPAADLPEGFPTDLPLAEAITVQHSKDAEPLPPLVGEYITRACFSRTWQLRDAALVYITTHCVGSPTTTTTAPSLLPLAHAYKPLVRLANTALRDKVANVVIAALGLLRALVQRAATDSSSSARDISSSLGEWLPAVIDKACDSNNRIKDAAVALVLYTAAVPEVHMGAHAGLLLRPIKHPGVFKVVLGRLQLLAALLPVVGLADGGALQQHQAGGLHVEPLMRFIAANGLSSANADVRGEATRLAVDLAGVVGGAVVRMLPNDVHSKIREQIAAAAGEGNGEEGNGGGGHGHTPVSAATSARRPGSASGSARRASGAGNGQGNAQGSGRRASARGGSHRGAVPPRGGGVGTQEAVHAHAVGGTGVAPSVGVPTQDDAVRLYEAEVAAREAALGPEHPELVDSLANLALLCSQKHDVKRAQALYERALAIMERHHGPQHTSVAHALTDLAVLHLEQGNDAVGRPLLQRALDIQERALGAQHPDVVAIRDVLFGED